MSGYKLELSTPAQQDIADITEYTHAVMGWSEPMPTIT